MVGPRWWGWRGLAAGVALLCLTAARAFPALSEQDPVVVVQSFQRALARSEGLASLLPLLSEGKRQELLSQTGGATEGPLAQAVLNHWRDHLLLMAPRLVQHQVDPERAILVFQGQVALEGQGLMQATLGVLLVREGGTWHIVRQKATYRKLPSPPPSGEGFDF